MASTAPATNILNGYPIRNFDTNDPGAVAFSNEIKGGHHQYTTLAERDAITSERREEGMYCTVAETAITYVLQGGVTNADWVPILFETESRIGSLESRVDDVEDRVDDLDVQVADLTADVAGLAVGDSFVAANLADLPSTVNSTGVTRFATVYDDSVSDDNNGRYFQENGSSAWSKVPGDLSGRVSTLEQLLPYLEPEGIPLANVETMLICPYGAYVIYNGESIDIADGLITEDGTALLVGWTPDGRQIPDSTLPFVPLLPFLEPQGIPLANVETMSSLMGQVYYRDRYRDIASGDTTEDGTALLVGWTPDGRQIPDPSPTGILYDSGTGLAFLTDSGTEVITSDGAAYTDIHHVSGGLWQCRSDRDGPMALLRVNVDEGMVMSAIPNHLWHILRTGQSLAEGWNSTPAAHTVSEWPGKSLMFNAGSQAGVDSYPLTGAELTSFVDLVEVGRESPLSEMANHFLSRCDGFLDYVPTILQSNHAQGGGGYSAIKKGTQPYANGITEVTRGHAIALSLGMTYEVPAICIDHGEADQDGNVSAATYQARMQELITDYTADILAITGQTRPPVLIQSQCSSHTIVHETVPTVALGQLSAALSDPRIFLACPKYFLEYAEDGIHLTQLGSLRLGDYDAQCLEWVLLGGADPATMPLLYPLSAVQSAGEIRITFHVPVGPLVLDTTRVLNPGNYGFELVGATITGVAIDGNDVVITKTGTATEWRYAYTGTLNAAAGPRTGARGCLRDSNPRRSRYYFSDPLHNWLVHCAYSL